MILIKINIQQDPITLRINVNAEASQKDPSYNETDIAKIIMQTLEKEINAKRISDEIRMKPNQPEAPNILANLSDMIK